MKIEGAVHRNVLAKNPKMEEQWKYNFMEDFYCGEKNELKDLEDMVAYDLAWIEEAKKMITVKRYGDLPKDFFQYYHFDGEDISFFDDDEHFDDEDCANEECSICNKMDDVAF